MGRVSRARRIATAALYGGGGIGVLGALTAGLVVSQINHAWRTIKPPKHPAPPCDGRYGPHQPGKPLTLAVLGDSSSTGSDSSASASRLMAETTSSSTQPWRP